MCNLIRPGELPKEAESKVNALDPLNLLDNAIEGSVEDT